MAREIVQQDISKVKDILFGVLGTSDYEKIERMGGLTNHTYHVWLENGEQYVVRIPGEGTEELIIREDEKISTKLACDLGIDARLLYFGDDGSKVTEYIKDAITMSAGTIGKEEHIHQIADIFRKLHTCGVDTGVPFEVFDMAANYEKIIKDYHVSMFDDYLEVKNQVINIKQEIDSVCDTTRVPCHNDSLCENWVVGNGKMYLIDWEYAGMNDGMWDLADTSIEAAYSHEQDTILLRYYLGKEPDSMIWKHFFANKIYVDYLWTLWAKTRVPFDGQPMEDWATERYERLKSNINLFYNI